MGPAEGKESVVSNEDTERKYCMKEANRGRNSNYLRSLNNVWFNEA